MSPKQCLSNLSYTSSRPQHAAETGEDECLAKRAGLIVVYDEVLSADQDAAWAIPAAWHRDEHVGAIVHRLAPFPRDVIEPQVKLVQGQVLLGLCSCFSSGILHSRAFKNTLSMQGLFVGGDVRSTR